MKKLRKMNLIERQRFKRALFRLPSDVSRNLSEGNVPTSDKDLGIIIEHPELMATDYKLIADLFGRDFARDKGFGGEYYDLPKAAIFFGIQANYSQKLYYHAGDKGWYFENLKNELLERYSQAGLPERAQSSVLGLLKQLPHFNILGNEKMQLLVNTLTENQILRPHYWYDEAITENICNWAEVNDADQSDNLYTLRIVKQLYSEEYRQDKNWVKLAQQKLKTFRRDVSEDGIGDLHREVVEVCLEESNSSQNTLEPSAKLLTYMFQRQLHDVMQHMLHAEFDAGFGTVAYEEKSEQLAQAIAVSTETLSDLPYQDEMKQAAEFTTKLLESLRLASKAHQEAKASARPQAKSLRNKKLPQAVRNAITKQSLRNVATIHVSLADLQKTMQQMGAPLANQTLRLLENAGLVEEESQSTTDVPAFLHYQHHGAANIKSPLANAIANGHEIHRDLNGAVAERNVEELVQMRAALLAAESQVNALQSYVGELRETIKAVRKPLLNEIDSKAIERRGYIEPREKRK